MNASNDKPLCLIPARGGSKRFPGKNITPLGGKPLIAWSIEAALKSGVFDDVHISSEEEEILKTAEQWGGKPLLRRADLAGDNITVVQVCLDIIHDFMERGQNFSALYVMLPTCPFRKSETIVKAWNAFRRSQADALMSIVPSDHPLQWALIERDGWLKPFSPDQYELNRQALEPTYRHDGGHAIANIHTFLENKRFLGPKTLAFPVPVNEAVDIDEPINLAWAEFLLQRGIVQ